MIASPKYTRVYHRNLHSLLTQCFAKTVPEKKTSRVDIPVMDFLKLLNILSLAPCMSASVGPLIMKQGEKKHSAEMNYT